jgi:hypothetical protein
VIGVGVGPQHVLIRAAVPQHGFSSRAMLA